MVAAVYSLNYLIKKRESLPPMPAAPHLQTPRLRPTLVDPRVNRIPPAITVRARGDLQRVRGIGKKYATLLESAGVHTVADLSKRNPRHLSQTLRDVNTGRNMVRRTPPTKAIEIWVNNAKTLELLVE
jgi:hypothetical protein